MNEGERAVEHEIARRRTILDAFDAVLDQPLGQRTRWLAERFPGDAALVAAVDALIAADATPTVLPATDRGQALVPPERVGNYRLVEQIGAGGMGEVWLGERADGLFDHRVAIKLMRPSLVSPELEAFFDSERRLLARLRHPHIARLFDGGLTAQGIGWFAMDLVEGVALDAWLAAVPPGPTPRADVARRVAMAATICEAVQHAHQNLIVHADLKPQNILVEHGDTPRLVDFGIAHLLAADDQATERAYPRTPAYASPERLGGAPPSVADDVYALGTLLHGLLTAQWVTDEYRHLAPPSLTAPAWLAGEVRGDLDAIVQRARAPDRAARYATAEALAADLRAWLERRPVVARGTGLRYVATRFVRRNRVAVALAGTALLALVATVVIVTSLYVRAEAARREADQRFADVRGLARYMLVDFHDALEPLAGASALRARTAEVGRSYLERLSRSRGEDAGLTRELGIGYGRVGHTLAVTATNGTRGMEAGDRALVKAQALLERIVRADPADRAAKVELARVLTWRSSVVAYARSDSAGAHRLLDRAFALDDAVLRQVPGDPAAEYGRWLAVLGRFDVWQQEQRWRDIAALAAAQQARTDMLVVPPAQAALRPLLEAAQQSAWGDALDWLGRPREALLHYAQAYRLLDRQLPRAASDVRVRTRMIGYAYQLSTVYDEVGDKPSALAWAERGVAAARTLSQFERSPAAAAMVNLVTLQHASLLVDAGRRDEALAEARASVEERRRSALAEPTSDDARSSYLFALRVLVELYDRAKLPAAACDAARTARDGWAALYRGRTPPEKHAGDIARIAAKVAECGARYPASR